MDTFHTNKARNVVQQAWPYLLLPLTFLAARYWFSGQFGLYEDDFAHLPWAAAMSLDEVLAFAFNPSRIINLFGQGHPLHYTFIYLLTNIAWRLGELPGLYWVGFFIQAINICLFYVLIRRIHSNALGVVSGMVFALYSADTTQAYLTFSFGLQTSITLLLLACHAYLFDKRWLAYGFAALTLLTYETAFGVFIAFPLMIIQPRRKTLRELVYHAIIMGAILAVMIAWRIMAGDDRVGVLGVRESISLPITHMLQGPIVSLGTFLYRPLQAFKVLDLGIAVAVLAGFLVWTAVLVLMNLETPSSLRSDISHLFKIVRVRIEGGNRLKLALHSLPREIADLFRLAFAGLLMLILAYPLTFTVRAFAITGRDTRVHAGGVIGAAVMIGALLLMLLWIAEIYRFKVWAALLIGVWIGSLAGFGIILQREYGVAWDNQQVFWSSMEAFIPDLEEDTIVLVDPAGLSDTQHIDSNTWQLPAILEVVYKFPDTWAQFPRAHRLLEDWRERSLWNSREIKAIDFKWEYVVSPWENVILLETEDGRVVNRVETITIDGVEYAIKPFDGGFPVAYTEGFIYKDLILSEYRK
ncbi:MAG: hypothetical protein ACERKX_03245 [Anaerolineales bacterium]